MSDVGQGGTPSANRPLGTETMAPQPYGQAGGTANGGTTESTTGTAKQQAGQVAQDAKESGKQVAGTAVEQGKDVMAEGRRQVSDLTRQTKQQVDEQSRVQKDKAAGGLRSLADELSTIGSGTGGQSGVATDLAQQAASKVQEIAGWIESREPGQLVDELRTIARRKPGTFLLGAVAAGLVAGRLTRGAVDAARSDDGSGTTTPAGTPTYDDLAASRTDVDLTTAPAAADDLPAGDPQYSGTSVGGYR